VPFIYRFDCNLVRIIVGPKDGGIGAYGLQLKLPRVKEKGHLQTVICYLVCFFVCLMMFNATFYNISVISWRSVLLVKETGVTGQNHRPAASH
jgi:hypothetical protein